MRRSPVITISLPSLRPTSRWLSSRVKNIHDIGAFNRIVVTVFKLEFINVIKKRKITIKTNIKIIRIHKNINNSYNKKCLLEILFKYYFRCSYERVITTWTCCTSIWWFAVLVSYQSS